MPFFISNQIYVAHPCKKTDLLFGAPRQASIFTPGFSFGFKHGYWTMFCLVTLQRRNQLFAIPA